VKTGGIEVERHDARARRMWFASVMLVVWEGFEAVLPSV